MKKALAFLKGKKSYIVAIVIAILGVLQGTSVFILPEWAWPIIGAAGLGALRSGINKTADSLNKKD